MSSPIATEIVDAGEHLPNGATLVIDQVSWDDYEYLLEGLADRPGLRISYDCGRLEIVSPSPGHGYYECLVEDLVLLFCEAFRIPLEKYGRTTWRRKSLSKGAVPDASFYIKNAGRIIGNKISLESDPPPDIIVEVEVTRSSQSKSPIYAALGVPELWRYDGKTCRFYARIEDGYQETRVSRFLPGLTGAVIAEAIELSKTKGQDEARKAFRRRIKALKKQISTNT
jgi:Uma2 family endonuclease